jgi:UDP-perosamine 4-acetyltransferase
VIRVVGFGAGGHAKVMIDALRAGGAFEVVGLLDPKRELHGRTISGVAVLGDDSTIEKLMADGVSAIFIGVGSAASTSLRQRLYEAARARGLDVIKVVHPSAVVSPAATLGRGVSVLAGAIVNASAILGDNVLVNTGAIVEHDCVIEQHTHIATGARVGGSVKIGTGVHVGIGASIRQGISVGAGVVIGAGAAVVDDVPDGAVVVGVPARPMTQHV